MGTGKSSVAREIALTLKCPLIDTDHLIAEREGISINEIFTQKGEEYFRDLETKVLKELTGGEDSLAVISLGGGTPLRSVNYSIIKELGYVVWLYTPTEETYKRVKENGERPLLKCDDPLARIKELLEERAPIYDKVSHIKINTSDLTISEIATGIIDSASYYFAEEY